MKTSIQYFFFFALYCLSKINLKSRKLAKNLADGNQDDNNPEAATRQTAQDFEDACNEELQRFKPAPRTTGRISKYVL